jgi:hypothetical protein
MRNEILYRPFENIPTRRGRGGEYAYIRWQDVADRMNEAFGDMWSSEVMWQDVAGGNVIVRVRVSVFNKETGTFSKQEGFGGAPNDERNEAGNPYKAAYSKALKDACKKWGLGLFLEEDGDEGSHTTPSSLPTSYYGKEHGVPGGNVVAPVQPAPAPAPPAPAVTTQAAPTGGLPTPPGIGMGTAPKAPEVVQESVTLTQAPPTSTAPPIPQAPTAATAPVPPPVSESGPVGLPTPPQVSLKEDMPMSKVNTINTGEPDKISDVQKAALHGILSFKGVDYETLAREAFEANGIVKNPIPPADDLTYQEAVYVVKYGNDKFRRR